MNDQNWRPETNALDYFGNQQKKLALENRRPVIRKASDLVGPGIGPAATRITDFGDLLATYNGYYSALPGAVDAPNNTDSFTGITVMDSVLGGWQEFRSLETGLTYRRGFTRNLTDPSTIYWSTWIDVSFSRVDALEDATALLDDRLDTAEDDINDLQAAQRPLITGTLVFFMTNTPTGGLASGTATFGYTFPTAPACWAIKVGFSSGSAFTIVSHVDTVTSTSCRVVIVNLGPTDANFTGMPIRWFAQQPN